MTTPLPSPLRNIDNYNFLQKYFHRIIYLIFANFSTSILFFMIIVQYISIFYFEFMTIEVEYFEEMVLKSNF